MVTIGLIAVVLVLIVFRQWKIRSGRYRTRRLTLRDRFLWAVVCTLPPASAFMEKPTALGAGVACLVFCAVFFCGRTHSKVSEQIDGEGLGSAGAPPSPSS